MPSEDDAFRTCGGCGAAAQPQDRFCRMCGAALSVAGAEGGVRRHVVVLFADLEGFTSISQGLDPELLRAIMERYFTLATQVIWRYGGVTEKFIGDAVMAVFGMPVIREDDALRAAHAASDIVTELDVLNVGLKREFDVELVVRIAVHAGPVSASYRPNGDFRIVGDTVNTASRLQSSAAPKQVLVSEIVAQAVRSRVELEEMPPLTVKGKDEPVVAWRLLSPHAPHDVPHRVPLVGREVELLQLQQTYNRTVRQGRGALVTLMGQPGIGKSRLAAEFLASHDDERLTVLSGHPTSYGRGVTYRPIVAMVDSAPGAWAAFSSRAMTDRAVATAQSCLAGLSEAADVTLPQAEVEDIASALHVFVQFLAQSGPVLLLWEDLHWAEPTLLDVIEYLADELDSCPVMQLCLARPELLDTWPLPGGRAGIVNIELAPLTKDETLALVTDLGRQHEVAAQGLDDDELCAVVAAACEGNPLFAELMLDVAHIPATGSTTPHTIQALLAARLDQLEVDDRLVLEMASVAGRDFVASDVEYLLERDERLDINLSSSLDRLRRARLITGNRLSMRHSFAQAFGRDTAYEMTAKRDRLRWHLALAERATTAATSSGPPGGEPHRSDLLPYHLEAALQLTVQLHPHSPSLPELRNRAATALAEQAIWAMEREDLRAASGLFERALLAQPADDPCRYELAVRLSDTWLGIGDIERARAVLADVASMSLCPVEIEIQTELVELRRGSRTPDEVIQAEQDIEPRIGGDERAQCRFYQLRAQRHLVHEQVGAAESSLAEALELARATGDTYQQRRIMRTACQLSLWGPGSVSDGLQRCRTLAVQFADSRASLVTILGATAGLLAFDGRHTQARETLDTATTYAAELRMRGADVALAHLWGVLESLAGRHHSAAEHFSRARSVLDDAGNGNGAALLGAYAACELVSAGEPLPAPYPTLSDRDVKQLSDPRIGALTAYLCLRSAADAGQHHRVLRLAAMASDFATRTDDLFFQGSIHHGLAVALLAAGQLDEALTAATAARDRFGTKGVRAVLPRVEQLIWRITRAQEGNQ